MKTNAIESTSIPRCLTLAAAVSLLGVLTAGAAVIVTPSFELQTSPFTPSWGNTVGTNLLSGLLPTSTVGATVGSNTAGLGALTDGVVGPITAYQPDPYPTALQAYVGTGPGGFSQATYSLGATGVQLSSIAVYGGWIDPGRDSQSFRVSYSTNNGTTYTPLALGTNSVTAAYGHDQSVANRTIVTDGTGILAGGALITNLRFDFTPVENGWTGTSEIAAFAVPEPGIAALLLSLGAVGFMRRRRAS